MFLAGTIWIGSKIFLNSSWCLRLDSYLERFGSVPNDSGAGEIPRGPGAMVHERFQRSLGEVPERPRRDAREVPHRSRISTTKILDFICFQIFFGRILSCSDLF